MKTILLTVATVLSSLALGQDCTGFWQNDLSTGVMGPKSFMGDTNAAYAAYQFYVNTSTVIRLRGSYPFARFLSIESYRTKKNNSFDTLYDYQITPNAGSANPFVVGKNAEIGSREYTVDFVPEGTTWTGAVNRLKVTSEDDIASIWVRYYAPNPGVSVSQKDMPTIEALDAATGKPTACPQAIEMNFFTNYPQILTYIVPHKSVLDFQPFAVDLAGNSAIPGYPETHSKMRRGEVAVIKFKAPSFADSISGDLTKVANVRYWSLCSINLVKNMGLACLSIISRTSIRMGSSLWFTDLTARLRTKQSVGGTISCPIHASGGRSW